VQNLNGPVHVYPAYSAYLFIAEALGTSKTLKIANIYPGRQANGSSITTALGDQSAGQLVAYGFWDESAATGRSSPTKLALLNMQIYNQTQAKPRPSAVFDISAFLQSDVGVRIRRLQAPGADVKNGTLTTWAGQTYSTGEASGRVAEELVTGGKIEVAASEAALVFL